MCGPSFSPDGTLLAAAWPDEVVRVFDVATGGRIAEIRVEARGAPNSARTESGSPSIDVDGRRPWSIDASPARSCSELDQHAGWIGDVGWSPDGRWIATAESDATVRIWDAATGELRFTMTGHTAKVNGLDWSPDGTRLATVSDDGTAHDLGDLRRRHP